MSFRRLSSSALPLALACLLSGAVVGCAGPQAPTPEGYTEGAEYQFARGEHFLSRKDFERARMTFQALAREYPFSQYAARSELRIADTYFEEKVYSAAIEAYRSFARLRPRHEMVPYADFQVVESYLRMMPRDRFLSPPTHERDLTDALLAYREARRYIIRYREGEYVDQARETVKEVANRLADHEIYVARYYERRDQYDGAMRRYQYLASSFPESDRVPYALLKLGESALKVERYDIVRDAYVQMANAHAEADELNELAAVVERAEKAQAEADAAEPMDATDEPVL